MFRALGLLALLFAALAAVPATAGEVLQPAGPWKIDYAPNECRLIRTFGTGDGAITLRFARGAGLDSFDMLIAGKALPKLGERVKVTLRLSPGTAAQDFDAYSMAVPGRPERFIRWYDGDPAILDGVTDDQRLEVSVAGKFSVTFDLAKGKAALKGLAHCHSELLAGWGVDEALLRGVAQRPKPRTPPYTWAHPSDYPKTALQKEHQGEVVAILIISPAGAVTQCKVAKSSLVTELDETTCRLLKTRAKYHPALDAAGKPVQGYDVQRIRWLIPEE